MPGDRNSLATVLLRHISQTVQLAQLRIGLRNRRGLLATAQEIWKFCTVLGDIYAPKGRDNSEHELKRKPKGMGFGHQQLTFFCLFFVIGGVPSRERSKASVAGHEQADTLHRSLDLRKLFHREWDTSE